MCLDGEWIDNAFADNPICGGSSGGTTERSNNSPALTEDDASISVAYCAASASGASDCSSSFIGVNKNTGQCYCVKSMDCDSGNGDTSVLNGHYMFAKESASGVSTCLVGVVASTCVSNVVTLCVSRM